MKKINKIFNSLSSLKVAISLLIVIAIACALGTAIPQGESSQTYLTMFGENPWLGFINGESLLFFQFDHVYTSYWFLFLLAWLSVSLLSCSWRRQWPILQASLRWIDYKSENQIKKLALSQSISSKNSKVLLDKFTTLLKSKGWEIKEKDNRIAARKGVLGRVGPLLVHLGLIILIIGATYGALSGQKLERFLIPGTSIDLLSPSKEKQLTLQLEKFKIQRDPKGIPEQFISSINLIEPNGRTQMEEISVNHPFRFKGLTLYQADWALAAVILQIDQSPKLQIPLELLPEIGKEVWGAVIPTQKDNTKPILLTFSSENGPVNVFNKNGENIGKIIPNGEDKQFNGASIRILKVLTSSGLLIKYDPGVPFVYSGFAITLLGGFLSIISTQQLWAICSQDFSLLHIGGLSNRNLSGFSRELPQLLSIILEH